MLDTPMETECCIVGGGPSLKDFDWSLLNDRYTIAINRAFQVVPDPNIIYFTDPEFYEEFGKDLPYDVRIIYGKSAVPCKVPMIGVEKWHPLKVNGLSKGKNQLSHGNNSMYACINLAWHLGFKTIYLLGLDLNGDDAMHFHSGYTHRFAGMKPQYSKMRASFEKNAPVFEKNGLKIYNCNPNSAVRCFEFKSPFDDK
jgi:hypothetical protein